MLLGANGSLWQPLRRDNSVLCLCVVSLQHSKIRGIKLMFSSRRLWKCCEVLLRRPGWTKVHAAFVRQLSTSKYLQSFHTVCDVGTAFGIESSELIPDFRERWRCVCSSEEIEAELLSCANYCEWRIFWFHARSLSLKAIHSFSDKERRGRPSVTVTRRTLWQRTLWQIWIVLSFSSLKRATF